MSNILSLADAGSLTDIDRCFLQYRLNRDSEEKSARTLNIVFFPFSITHTNLLILDKKRSGSPRK